MTECILRSIKYRDQLFRWVRPVPNGTDFHISSLVNISANQTIDKKTIKVEKQFKYQTYMVNHQMDSKKEKKWTIPFRLFQITWGPFY